MADISSLPPGLRGYLAGEQANQRRESGSLQQLLGVTQLQQHLEAQRHKDQIARVLSSNLPPEQKQAELLKLPGGAELVGKLVQMQQQAAQTRNYESQAPLNQARTLEALQKMQEVQTQSTARATLSGFLNPATYTDPQFGTPEVAIGEDAALKRAMELDARKLPARVVGVDPAKARSLAIQAKMGGPEMTALGITQPTERPQVIPAGAGLRLPGERVPGYVQPFAPRTERQSDIATLNADLAAGRITPEQFDQASKTRLGAQSVIPEEHSTLHGAEYLATLPVGIQNAVKSIVEGKVPLTSFSIRNNQRDAMIQRATQYDPTFEAGKAPARMAVQRDFTSGVAARNVTAINTAIRHMGTLDELGTALDSKNVQVINMAINKIRTQFGDPRVNNFDTAKGAVGNELMRVFRQVNASDQETKDWEAKFSSAQSPEQMRGAIKTGVALLQGRIEALDEQWKRGMDTDKGYPQLLTPVTKDILGKLGGNPKRRAVDTAAPLTFDDVEKERRYQEWKKNNP